MVSVYYPMDSSLIKDEISRVDHFNDSVWRCLSAKCTNNYFSWETSSFIGPRPLGRHLGAPQHMHQGAA